jgi:hypothetical protein
MRFFVDTSNRPHFMDGWFGNFILLTVKAQFQYQGVTSLILQFVK